VDQELLYVQATGPAAAARDTSTLVDVPPSVYSKLASETVYFL